MLTRFCNEWYNFIVVTMHTSRYDMYSFFLRAVSILFAPIHRQAMSWEILSNDELCALRSARRSARIIMITHCFTSLDPATETGLFVCLYLIPRTCQNTEILAFGRQRSRAYITYCVLLFLSFGELVEKFLCR